MAENKPRTLLPEILEEQINADGTVLELRVPESLAYVDGHFPNIPIVPGVVQIHWAVLLARQQLRLPLYFHHMEVVKFKALIRPSQRLRLHLRYNPQMARLQFAYRYEQVEYSSGRIYFHGNEV